MEEEYEDNNIYAQDPNEINLDFEDNRQKISDEELQRYKEELSKREFNDDDYLFMMNSGSSEIFNFKNINGNTILIVLVSNLTDGDNTEQLTKIINIVNYGANLDIVSDDDGATPLIAALYSYQPDVFGVVRLLLERGADVNITNNDGYSAISLIQQDSLIDTAGLEERIALFNMFMMYNPILTTLNNNGLSVLFYIIINNKFPEYQQYVLNRLKDEQLNYSNLKFTTIYIFAMIKYILGELTYNCLELIVYNIKNKAPEVLSINDEQTDQEPIIAALLNKQVEDKAISVETYNLLKLLLDNQILDLNKLYIDEDRKETILHILIDEFYMHIPMDNVEKRQMMMKIVELLIERGFDITLQNERGLTVYDMLVKGSPNDNLLPLLDFRRRFKIKINITKTITNYDPIMMEEEEINVGKYIMEDPDNIVIVYNQNEYFFTTREIINNQSEDAMIYPCKVPDSMRRQNILMNMPLYDMKKIGFVYGYPCVMTDYLENPRLQLFALVNSNQSFPAFVSHASLQPDANWVSALHCQAGQESRISYLVPAYPAITDNGAPPAHGGNIKPTRKLKRNIRKNTKTRKTTNKLKHRTTRNNRTRRNRKHKQSRTISRKQLKNKSRK